MAGWVGRGRRTWGSLHGSFSGSCRMGSLHGSISTNLAPFLAPFQAPEFWLSGVSTACINTGDIFAEGSHRCSPSFPGRVHGESRVEVKFFALPPCVCCSIDPRENRHVFSPCSVRGKPGRFPVFPCDSQLLLCPKLVWLLAPNFRHEGIFRHILFGVFAGAVYFSCIISYFIQLLHLYDYVPRKNKMRDDAETKMHVFRNKMSMKPRLSMEAWPGETLIFIEDTSLIQALLLSYWSPMMLTSVVWYHTRGCKADQPAHVLLCWAMHFTCAAACCVSALLARALFAPWATCWAFHAYAACWHGVRLLALYKCAHFAASHDMTQLLRPGLQGCWGHLGWLLCVFLGC